MDILLVDDHVMFQEGLTMVLRNIEPDINVVAKDNAEDALSAAQAHEFDIVLLDYNLPDTDGLTILVQLKSISPATPVVMLSAEENATLIQRALQEGANGFITKSSTADVMMSAIKLVLSGGLYIPSQILASGSPPPAAVSQPQKTPAAQAVDQVSNYDFQLTERQREVLNEMAKGLSNKEIARELDMSPSTVKVHVAAILRELEVKNRTQAVSKARRKGLVESD